MDLTSKTVTGLELFPYPYVYRGTRRPGLLVPWPERCEKCRDRPCESARTDGVALCPYGVNYQRVLPDLLVAGVVLKSFHPETSERKKRQKEVGKSAVAVAEFHRAISGLVEYSDDIRRDLDDRRAEVLTTYRGSPAFREDLVESVRPELTEFLSRTHDYRQLVQQIIQNLGVILETSHPGLTLDDQLERASHEEVAIYWSARLIEEKLDAISFLAYPERIHDPRSKHHFRFHGMVTKYWKIYKRRITDKKLKLDLRGESYASVRENDRAISVIPHALIDNAVKYAPPGSEVVLTTEDRDGKIRFAVSSHGPVITSTEQTHIFELFFRGDAAKARDADGTGFGLGAAQFIAKEIGVVISVEQDSVKRHADGSVWTTFEVEFEAVDERSSTPPNERPRGGRRKSRSAGDRRRSPRVR